MVTVPTTPVQQRYSLIDLSMVSFRQIGIGSPEAQSAVDWIKAMTPAEDGEDGPDFWQWISDNNTAVTPGSIYDTFLFLDNNTRTVVATASIVRDDRGVGTSYRIPGDWLGGVNVRREFRQCGIGKLVLQMVDARMHEWARNAKQDIKINLFTDNPIAVRMYESIGYRRFATHDVHATRKMMYSKTVLWKTRDKAHVLTFINDLNTRALTYHNHKEASAWAGLAFYYLIMFGWIVPLGLHEPFFDSWGTRGTAIFTVLVVTVFVWIYIDNQLKLRDIFGNFTAACYRLSARCINMDDDGVMSLDLSVPNVPAPAPTGRAFPRALRAFWDTIRRAI